jgi:hypothetical protein
MFSGPARIRAFYFDTGDIVRKRHLRHPSRSHTARDSAVAYVTCERSMQLLRWRAISCGKHRQTFL